MEKMEIAKKMKSLHIPVKQIAEACGLTVEEIAQL